MPLPHLLLLAVRKIFARSEDPKIEVAVWRGHAPRVREVMAAIGNKYCFGEGAETRTRGRVRFPENSRATRVCDTLFLKKTSKPPPPWRAPNLEGRKALQRFSIRCSMFSVRCWERLKPASHERSSRLKPSGSPLRARIKVPAFGYLERFVGRDPINSVVPAKITNDWAHASWILFCNLRNE
jgi:hypothetical protein